VDHKKSRGKPKYKNAQQEPEKPNTMFVSQPTLLPAIVTADQLSMITPDQLSMVTVDVATINGSSRSTVNGNSRSTINGQPSMVTANQPTLLPSVKTDQPVISTDQKTPLASIVTTDQLLKLPRKKRTRKLVNSESSNDLKGKYINLHETISCGHQLTDRHIDAVNHLFQIFRVWQHLYLHRH